MTHWDNLLKEVLWFIQETKTSFLFQSYLNHPFNFFLSNQIAYVEVLSVENPFSTGRTRKFLPAVHNLITTLRERRLIYPLLENAWTELEVYYASLGCTFHYFDFFDTQDNASQVNFRGIKPTPETYEGLNQQNLITSDHPRGWRKNDIFNAIKDSGLITPEDGLPGFKRVAYKKKEYYEKIYQEIFRTKEKMNVEEIIKKGLYMKETLPGITQILKEK